jgi:hypothetical protein
MLGRHLHGTFDAFSPLVSIQVNALPRARRAFDALRNECRKRDWGPIQNGTRFRVALCLECHRAVNPSN